MHAQHKKVAIKRTWSKFIHKNYFTTLGVCLSFPSFLDKEMLRRTHARLANAAAERLSLFLIMYHASRVSFFSARKVEARFSRNNQSGVFFCCVKIAKSSDRKKPKNVRRQSAGGKLSAVDEYASNSNYKRIQAELRKNDKKWVFGDSSPLFVWNDCNTWRIRRHRGQKIWVVEWFCWPDKSPLSREQDLLWIFRSDKVCWVM